MYRIYDTIRTESVVSLWIVCEHYMKMEQIHQTSRKSSRNTPAFISWCNQYKLWIRPQKPLIIFSIERINSQLPVPPHQRLGNRLQRILEQVLANAAEIVLQKNVPVQFYHVEEEQLFVACGQCGPQAVDGVQLVFPLTHRKVLNHVHEAVDLLVGVEESESSRNIKYFI